MSDLEQVKAIMGKNFIGPQELENIGEALGIQKPLTLSSFLPAIKYPSELLQAVKNNFILILGLPTDKQNKPLTLNQMRKHLGVDPNKSEPCFYNQDWYLKEDFAAKKTMDLNWYLIKKEVREDTRGKNPDEIPSLLQINNEILPSALLTAFAFFAYYFLNREILWKHDFIWCSDTDHNGDLIYTGRYLDPTKTNKNGFNIHRHLKIRSCYGAAPQII